MPVRVEALAQEMGISPRYLLLVKSIGPSVAGDVLAGKELLQPTETTGEIPRQPRRDARVPLSFAQERLWFLEQLDPGYVGHVLPLTFALHGAFDSDAWQSALGEVVRRHEALRTLFRADAGRLVGVVVPPEPVPLQLHDLSSLPPARRKSRARRLILAEARRLFDLQRGLLLRAMVVRLTPQDHWVLLALHHIAADGWSVRIVLSEVAQLYKAFASGRPPALPELPIQYADFAAWQRERLSGEMVEHELAFWRKQLADEPVLHLPTDFPRPPVQSFRGASLRVALSPELRDALRLLSRTEGATLFMTLIAGFQVLLARYAGQDTVCVGTPIAGRQAEETERLIGLFVNTLVLRTDLAGDPTVRDTLQRVREVALLSYVHQELPFEKLVHELQPERNLSHPPFFQVLFMLENVGGAELALPGLAATNLQIERMTMARFDLTMSLTDNAHGLRGRLDYATALFERATIERFLGHFETLLAAMTAEPAKRIFELPLLTAAERRQLLVDGNATAASYPEATLAELLAAASAARPEAVAIEHSGGRLTYAELEARANRFASYLAARGVGPEVRVGLYLERSLDLPVALLGILKAGGVYVPLHTAYPRERIAFVLKQAAAQILVTQEALRFSLPNTDIAVLCLDSEWEAIARESAHPFSCPALPDNLVYVIFTSGSTGQPKGVQVTHRALVNFLEAMRREPGLAEGEALLAVTTLSFDIAGLEFYLPLLVGGRVVIASRETSADGRLLAAELVRSGATVLQAPPATWWMLLQSGWQGNRQLRALCGGEAMPEEIARQLLPKVASLWNLYGPTETTVWSSVAEVREGELVRVGPPIANTTFYIVDRQFQPVPAGVPGELLIGGEGLARGYLGLPDLTAERFVPDPFGGHGGRLYRTGDRLRWRSDGRLEFFDRLDLQLKVRGFRIEVREVEAALAAQAGVEQAVVVAKGGVAERRLVAYVVGSAEMRHLEEALRECLPEYMVPSVFVRLGALPLFSSGKLDRKALPEPDAAWAVDYAPPRTLIEELLAEIWRDVLGTDGIGIHDDFFRLGGHSLLAAQVVARVRQALQVELPVRALFESPSLAGLAEQIGRASAEGAAVARLTSHLRSVPSLETLISVGDKSWSLPEVDFDTAVSEVLGDELAGLRLTPILPLVFHIPAACAEDDLVDLLASSPLAGLTLPLPSWFKIGSRHGASDQLLAIVSVFPSGAVRSLSGCFKASRHGAELILDEPSALLDPRVTLERIPAAGMTFRIQVAGLHNPYADQF